MKRRTALKLLCGGIGTFWTAVIAAPVVQFLIAPLFRKKKSVEESAIVKRVTLLNQLPTDTPQIFPITGSRQDAWTRYPIDVIGRVWLIRRTDADVDPQSATVEAFSSICPHLGCDVQLKSEEMQFICPCHAAAFDGSGAPIDESVLGHKNVAPRGLDSLECRIIQDEETEEWWVEVKFQKFISGPTTKIVKT